MITIAISITMTMTFAISIAITNAIAMTIVMISNIMIAIDGTTGRAFKTSLEIQLVGIVPHVNAHNRQERSTRSPI